jgi:hypothetical protein
MKKIQRSKLINVTQRDIDKGDPYVGDLCPVARAMCRAFKKGLGFVNTDGDTIEIGYNTYKAPKSVDTFVDKFDNGETVKPFSFTFRY